MPRASAVVFDDVRAFLSDQVLRSIPDGIETFFQENGVPGKLQEDVSTTCLRYLIQGSFLDILTAREILQKHVLQQDAIGPCQISDAEEVTLSIAFQDGIQDPCGDDVASHEVIRTNDADDSTELPVKEEAFNLSSETTLLVNVVPDPNNCGEFCPTDLQHAFQEVRAVADDGVLEQSDSSSVPLPDPMVIEIHCSKLEDAMLDLPVKTLHNCDKCAFTTLRLGHLRRHEATHSNLLHHCSHCSYATDDQKLLLRHNRMRHYCVKRPRVAPAKPMECPHCSYRTTRPLLLARHRQRHSGDSATAQGPLHQCAQCGYQTHRKEHLVRHRTNVHGGARPFLCHRCGKAFKRADALRQHHLTHGTNSQEADGMPRASFPCTQCHKEFRTHSHLTEHKAIHSTARPFLCEICGSAFKTRSVQRKHVQSVHRNPRAFCCACCGKKFNTQYALKRHQKLHSSHGVEEEDAPVTEAAAPPFSDKAISCSEKVLFTSLISGKIVQVVLTNTI
ncbi:zinc finger protein, putative [Ixodes scapularis]|uniref:Zinc finger protein, putative n=1 Tax=Ixodes scapularis TaxID=6945 RepID=B7PAK2_IXOSC|nr:zinc finger protein, putative [Ixodes scapularis]|eukprot:XP_002406955.1 zinc finger protein, putative [Ixodes scapularis]